MQFEYDEKVAERYDPAIPIGEGEVEFYLELAREAEARGLRTLEPGCGTGRIAIPLAREGVRIVGLDVSSAMLSRAREKSRDLANAEWVEGDMRDFDLGEEFGLVMIPVGTFQLLLTVEDQMSCLRAIHRHLAPGGRFAFEVENPNFVAMAEWLTTKRGTLVRNPRRDYRHPVTGLQVRSWGMREFHPSEQRAIGHGLIEELDDEDVMVRRIHQQPIELHYFFRYEVEHLLARCGFEIEALYGDVRKNEYRSTSPDFIWVARKA